MPAFPKLRTDAVAQYPSSRELIVDTCVTRFVDGSEQRFRNLREPVRLWVLTLADVSDEEMAALEDFFIACQGSAGSFSFVDPWDGVEYPDCSFEDESFELSLHDHGRCRATLTIRNNQV